MKSQTNTKNKFVLIICLLLFTIRANAQHDHSSHGHEDSDHSHKIQPPHGGEIKDIGKYHLEIVFDKMYAKDQFKIYLLKANLKPIDFGDGTATIKLSYKNGIEASFDFKNQGEFMVTSVKDVVTGFDAIISINYKGKTHTVLYQFKGL